MNRKGRMSLNYTIPFSAAGKRRESKAAFEGNSANGSQSFLSLVSFHGSPPFTLLLPVRLDNYPHCDHVNQKAKCFCCSDPGGRTEGRSLFSQDSGNMRLCNFGKRSGLTDRGNGSDPAFIAELNGWHHTSVDRIHTGWPSFPFRQAGVSPLAQRG
jgi:hypothetical protein